MGLTILLHFIGMVVSVLAESSLRISRAEKRHEGIVQCAACVSGAGGAGSVAGSFCALDAALLTVMPVQVNDPDYSAEEPKTMHIPSQPPKRHSEKNNRKHEAVLIPPSRPNVTRLSDESATVSWTHDNHGLPIQFFKVQYKEVTNFSNVQWHIANHDIPAHIHSFEIDGLTPDKYYKFRIAAVYSNQDNKLGRSSSKFFLQRGGFQGPKTPVLEKATTLSPHSIQLNWTPSEVRAERGGLGGATQALVGAQASVVESDVTTDSTKIEKVKNVAQIPNIVNLIGGFDNYYTHA